MAITETWLKANHKKQRTKPLEKGDRDGISVRLSPKGKVTYTMRYRYNGQAKRLDLGTYPLMSLKEARTENLRLKKELEQGHDPKIVRLLQKQAIMNADSLESLFTQWYEHYCIHNKKNHSDIKRTFEIHVFPKIGKLPSDKITLHQWLALLEELAKEKPGVANRILTNTKQMLKWGVKRQLLKDNVLSGIYAREDLQIKNKTGARSLSDEEIKMVWRAIDNSHMLKKNKLFVKLCLIYGCRNGELRLAKKEHFNFETNVWTIPQENHKVGHNSGQPLLRPITSTIQPYLEEAFSLSLGSDFVFTNNRSTDPMGQSAPLTLPYNIMQHLRRHENYEMAHWSLHDLRKTARTNFSKLTQPHVAEIMLGHSLGGVWRVYDHYDYLKEQAEALEAWCERLFELVGHDDQHHVGLPI